MGADHGDNYDIGHAGKMDAYVWDAFIKDDLIDCATLFHFLLNAEPELSKDVLRWLAEHMPLGGTLIANNHMNLASSRGIATWLSNTLLGTKHNYLSCHTVSEMFTQTGFRVAEWSGYRILPTIRGKSVFGKTIQVGSERLLSTLRLGRFGAEQVIIAERI